MISQIVLLYDPLAVSDKGTKKKELGPDPGGWTKTVKYVISLLHASTLNLGTSHS